MQNVENNKIGCFKLLFSFIPTY